MKYEFRVNNRVFSLKTLISLGIEDYNLTLGELLEGVEIDSFVSDGAYDTVRLVKVK